MGEYNYSFLKSCGKDVFISDKVEIRRPHLVEVGNNVAIDTGFYCTTQAIIGDYVHIAPYVTIIGGAVGEFKMGHFTTISAGSRIICTSDNHLGDGLVGPMPPEKYQDSRHCEPVIMEDFSSVTTNCVVFPGVTMKQGSVLGINSYIKSDAEAWSIYLGNPAKKKKDRPSEKMIAAARELGYDLGG